MRAERAGGERQIVLEEGASLDQPHTGVEAPVAQPPAQELSAEDWKKRWLNDCATELESASKENAEQRVEHALCLGIATIMDAAGTSRKMTPGVTRDLTPLLQPHLRYFQFNDSYYSFRVGEFPDFDSLCDYRASHEKWANGRPRLSEGAAALQHWEESEPQFPMDLVAQAKTRTTQAQALLR